MASSHTWTVSGERGLTRAWPTAHRHVAAPVPLSHRRLISGKVRQKTPMVRGRPPERYPLATIAGVAGAAVFARPSHNRNLPCGFAGSMAPVRGWPGWRGVPVGVSSTGARRPSRTTAPFPPSPRKSRRPCEVPKTPRPTHPALPRLFTCKIQKRGVCARNSRSWPAMASHNSPPFSETARKQPVMRSRRAAGRVGCRLAGRAEVPPGRPRRLPPGRPRGVPPGRPRGLPIVPRRSGYGADRIGTTAIWCRAGSVLPPSATPNDDWSYKQTTCEDERFRR